MARMADRGIRNPEYLIDKPNDRVMSHLVLNTFRSVFLEAVWLRRSYWSMIHRLPSRFSKDVSRLITNLNVSRPMMVQRGLKPTKRLNPIWLFSTSPKDVFKFQTGILNALVIIITADAQRKIYDKVISIGAFMLLKKPPSRDIIKAAVLKAMDTHKNRGLSC